VQPNLSVVEDRAGSSYDSALRKQMSTRWAGLTEGLHSRSAWQGRLGGMSDAEAKLLLAFMAESEHGHLQRVGGVLAESGDGATYSANLASYYKTILPVLRRLVVNLLTPNLVTTVPLGGPIGAIFVREARYASSKAGTVRNTKMLETLDTDYMTEKVNGEHVATADGTKYGGAGAALNVTLAFSPVRPLDSTNGYSLSIIEYNGSTAVQTATDDGAGGFTGDGTGSIDYASGAVTGFLFTVAPTSTRLIKAVYWYNSEGSDKIGDVNLDTTLVPVVSRTNKIKGHWSAEAGDNYASMYGLDVESDLSSILTNEMALETDRNTVQDILSYATSDGVSATYDRALGANDDGDMGAIGRILNPITDVSQRISEIGKRGPANWIVASSAICGILRNLGRHADFTTAAALNNQPGGSPMNAVKVPQSHNDATVDFGVLEFGLLGSQWRVYEDPYLTRTKMLMGRRGDNVLDADYIWSPFVMMQMTGTFMDPSNMTFRKGIRSRDARTRLRPNFGVITVSNLTLS
jgi:hypothetical protein